jgi:hypothetical protein
MFLLDTDIFVAMRERPRDQFVAYWMDSVMPEHIYVSVSTIRTLQRDITLQRTFERAAAEQLAKWVETFVALHEDRIIAVDVAIARRWGHLMGLHGNKNSDDLLLAATAIEHELAVVTRKTPAFADVEVRVFNPHDEIR